MNRNFSRTGLRTAGGLVEFSVGDPIIGLDDRRRRAWVLGGHLCLPVSVKQPARLFFLSVQGQEISIVLGCLSSRLSPSIPPSFTQPPRTLPNPPPRTFRAHL